MNIQSGGITYDLSHLKTTYREVEVELRGGFPKMISLEFKFSNHCYTRAIEEGELIPEKEKIKDGSIKKPRFRTFDCHRYDLSFHVMTLIDELIQKKGKVFDSPHHNFHHCELIRGDRSIHYVIFMNAEKIKDAPKRIQVYVESAYSYDPEAPPFSTEKPQSFFKKLSNIWSRS